MAEGDARRRGSSRWFALACALLAAILVSSAVRSQPHAQDGFPSEEQRRSVEQVVAYYFDMLDAGRYTEARAVFIPPVQARMSLEELETAMNGNIAQYGAVSKRVIEGYAWQRSGSNIGTGFAVVVPFSGEAGEGRMLCGYLLFLEVQEASFLLFKDDTTYFTVSEVAGATAETLKKLFNRPGCRRFIKKAG